MSIFSKIGTARVTLSIAKPNEKLLKYMTMNHAPLTPDLFPFYAGTWTEDANGGIVEEVYEDWIENEKFQRLEEEVEQDGTLLEAPTNNPFVDMQQISSITEIDNETNTNANSYNTTAVSTSSNAIKVLKNNYDAKALEDYNKEKLEELKLLETMANDEHEEVVHKLSDIINKNKVNEQENLDKNMDKVHVEIFNDLTSPPKISVCEKVNPELIKTKPDVEKTFVEPKVEQLKSQSTSLEEQTQKTENENNNDVEKELENKSVDNEPSLAIKENLSSNINKPIPTVHFNNKPQSTFSSETIKDAEQEEKTNELKLDEIEINDQNKENKLEKDINNNVNEDILNNDKQEFVNEFETAKVTEQEAKSDESILNSVNENESNISNVEKTEEKIIVASSENDNNKDLAYINKVKEELEISKLDLPNIGHEPKFVTKAKDDDEYYDSILAEYDNLVKKNEK